jgi:signal transduction histidine kinase
MNLVVNALDSMPTGGKLSITVDNVAIDSDYVDSHPWATEGRLIKVEVADTGTGVSESMQELIFERFFRTKLHGAGTGSGLT